MLTKGKTYDSLLSMLFADLPKLPSAQRRVREKLEGLDSRFEADVKEKQNDPEYTVPLSIARDYYEKQIQRLKSIEAKARVTTVGITIAFGVMFAGVGFLYSQDFLKLFGTASVTAIAATAVLVMGILFLVAAGLLSLKAMQFGEIHVIEPHEESTLDNSEIAVYLVLCTKMNELLGYLKQNYASVSFLCMRNGVVCITLFILILTIAVPLVSSLSEPSHMQMIRTS